MIVKELFLDWMHVMCTIPPCLWPICILRQDRRDNCVSLVASGTSSLYCFPAGGERKLVRQPRKAPLSQPRVTGSEITRLNHTITEFKIVIFTVLPCAGVSMFRITLSASARQIFRSATNRFGKPKNYKQSVALIEFWSQSVRLRRWSLSSIFIFTQQLRRRLKPLLQNAPQPNLSQSDVHAFSACKYWPSMSWSLRAC